jgi:glycosyltransferase involved in cell wall biosynthesis
MKGQQVAMNLKMRGNILYISSVDVSIGNGPGVNEREFILALYQAIGDRAHFLIPRPADVVADVPMHACTFALPHRHHDPRYLPGHTLSQMWLADRLLAQRQFDLLVFRLDILPIAPLYITRRHRTPYALKTLGQGMVNILNEKGGLLGKSLVGVNRRMVRQLVDRALAVDSVSLLQVEYLERLLGIAAGKIVWVDNAANTHRFFPTPAIGARRELGLAAFDPIIGYVGNLPWERGARQLVQALPLLQERYPNIGAVILGDGIGLDGLKRLAQELQVADRCLFTGYVPLDRVPLYINCLDVGVSISLRDDRSAASELKVRQYLACGKPVVASPGSNDFLTSMRLGSIVPRTNLPVIAAELDRWLSMTTDERLAFAQRASAYVSENLSIGAAVARRLDLWTERLQMGHPNYAF